LLAQKKLRTEVIQLEDMLAQVSYKLWLLMLPANQYFRNGFAPFQICFSS
jgi:hypothetical protein